MLILKRVLLGDETAQASHLLCRCEVSGRDVDILRNGVFYLVHVLCMECCILFYTVAHSVEMKYTCASKASADDCSM